MWLERVVNVRSVGAPDSFPVPLRRLAHPTSNVAGGFAGQKTDNGRAAIAVVRGPRLMDRKRMLVLLIVKPP